VAKGARWLPPALPVCLAVAWYAVTASGRIPAYQLASPRLVWLYVQQLAARGTLWQHLGASAERVLMGFGIAFAAAVLLGTCVGLWSHAEQLIDPTLQAVRAVPSLAWVPLLLIWLGVGELAKIALVAIGAFFPIYVNLVSGIRAVDRKLVEVARIYGYEGWRLAARVVLPATLPSLLVGARIGLTQAWLFLVAAELLASTRGLGYLLIEGQQTSRTDEVLAAILLLATCGKLSEMAMRALERRWLRWTDGLAT